MTCKSNKPLLILFLLACTATMHAKPVIFCGHEDNDLYGLMVDEGLEVKLFKSLDDALDAAPRNSGLFVAAEGYPEDRTQISAEQYSIARKKKVRMFIEFPSSIPGMSLPDECYHGALERAVVTSDIFGAGLPEMSLLTVNDCHIIPAEAENPVMVYAKVAGFDRAEYGLTDTDVYPLLFMHDNMTMAAMSALSNFRTARFGPGLSWRLVWETLLGWLTGEDVSLDSWEPDPRPMFSRDEPLPENARLNAVMKGTEWLYNARFFIHPSWKQKAMEYQSDINNPSGPPVPQQCLNGDGCHGVLEGHQSYIYHDGSQRYRYWRRCDVQGEVAFLLAASSDLTGSDKYRQCSENLLDFMFYEAEYRQGAHNDRNSPVYGLLGWGDNANWVFYSDDNARAVLGAIGASALIDSQRWNTMITENILANFRTSSRQGFHGERLHEQDIIDNGWQFYANRDYTFINMNFESYCWALYLWLYDKTGYRPLLDKAKTAIKITMEAYPDNWHFLQGIQSEKARLLLPLSWLVRAEDTPEHRKWLDTIISDLLKEQDACGAFKENLGEGTGGSFGRTPSNAAYGTAESPLNFSNRDKVSDLLYTSNFILLGLNEAAHATGNPVYRDAVQRLADFIVRIQVDSEDHPDIDGAWFRAFDFGRWDYWAENADMGWGAWSTLTGWSQSWIVGTLALMEKGSCFWDETRDMDMEKDFNAALWMLEQ